MTVTFDDPNDASSILFGSLTWLNLSSVIYDNFSNVFLDESSILHDLYMDSRQNYLVHDEVLNTQRLLSILNNIPSHVDVLVKNIISCQKVPYGYLC